MRIFLTIVTIFFPIALDAAEPSVKLAGILTVFDDGSEKFDGFKTFNTNQGHQVALIIDGGGRWIVGLDQKKASLKIGGVVAQSRFFGGRFAFSDDQRSMRLEYDTRKHGKLSADGTLGVVGSIPIVLATGKEEVRSVAFSAENGVEVKFPNEKAAGLPVMKVKSADKPGSDDDGFEIEFSTNRMMDDFAGVVFYDEEGRLLESRSSGSSWMAFGKQGRGEVSFTLKGTPKKVILALEQWTGREELELKVDFAVRLVAAP